MRWLRNASTVLALAAVGIFVGPITPACACSCVERTPAEQFEESEMAFRGVVTEVDRPLISMSTGDTVTVTLAVSEVFKGTVTSRMTVTTSSDGASCGYGFVEGREYVVLASRHNGGATTGLCSGNRDLTTENNPYAGGAQPLPAPPEQWPVAATAATTVGAAALILGAALWFWRRRRADRVAGPAPRS